MTDFVDSKRQEITDRIAELKPLIEEYVRLEAAATALAGIPGSTNGASAATPRVTRGGRRGPGRPRGSKNPSKSQPTTSQAAAKSAPKLAGKKGGAGRPKGSGKRALEALASIQGQPGITIPEMARKMKIKQNYLYRVLPGLEQEKKVVKKGRGWHPAPGA